MIIPRISQETDEGITTVSTVWENACGGVMVVFSSGDDEAIWAWSDVDHQYGMTGQTFSLRAGLPAECRAKIINLE